MSVSITSLPSGTAERIKSWMGKNNRGLVMLGINFVNDDEVYFNNVRVDLRGIDQISAKASLTKKKKKVKHKKRFHVPFHVPPPSNAENSIQHNADTGETIHISNIEPELASQALNFLRNGISMSTRGVTVKNGKMTFNGKTVVGYNL